jgi:hypothetical protein
MQRRYQLVLDAPIQFLAQTAREHNSTFCEHRKKVGIMETNKDGLAESLQTAGI